MKFEKWLENKYGKELPIPMIITVSDLAEAFEAGQDEGPDYSNIGFHCTECGSWTREVRNIVLYPDGYQSCRNTIHDM